MSSTSSVTTIDFNTGLNQVSRGTSYLESGVTFTAPSGVYSIYDIGYDAAYHNTGYIDLQGSPLGMSFSSNISALSFDFGGFYDNTVDLVVALGNGDVFNLNALASVYGFFGITTDVAFSSITITTDNNFTGFDNVSFGTTGLAPVPEPTTMLLLGLGLIGLAGVRRKFNK